MSKDFETERPDFAGARVMALESRRSAETGNLIASFGGIPHVSPSMREVPLEDPTEVIEFAKGLMTGQVDMVIFLTGVGFNVLLEAVSRHLPRERFLATLRDVTTVARGPKPVEAMRLVGLEATIRVPEPNTWRELIATLDAETRVANQVIAIQEYGEPNPSLLAGLEARGARLIQVPVYTWDLPEDVGPLERNIEALCGGERDFCLVTSAWQVVSMLRVARRMGLEEPLGESLKRVVMASIGPTSTESLRRHGFAADFIPSRPKLGIFVRELAIQSGTLRTRKQTIGQGLAIPRSPSDPSAAWSESLFMKACRREATPRTPVWLMRQAGRYLPEYRELRGRIGFLELCRRPDLCAEIMAKTVARLDVDAGIIFSDLLPILEPMGMDLEYLPGDGPKIHNPIREGEDVERVVELETVDALHFVMETVRQTRAAIPAHIPLIGFSGAPFTLASYAIEGESSRSFLHTKTLMYRDPGAWNELMRRLTRGIIRYIDAQIAAGAQAIQIFDSWAGALGPHDYRRCVLPYMREIIAHIDAAVPVISFATGNPALLPLLAETRPAVVGIDWRISLDQAWRLIGPERGIQGNLDPAVLLGDVAYLRDEVARVLAEAAGQPGHIFNLGHGVLPQTPVDNVLRLIDAVRDGAR